MSGLVDMTLNRKPRHNKANWTLPIIKGTAEGEEFESVVDHIIENIIENCTAEMERKVGSAVSETVSNVKLHAYPSADNDSNNKAWWLMCSEIEGSLYLAIYDSGVGIPKTIHKRSWISDFIVNSAPHLVKAWTSHRDVDKINISMEAGRTQTKEKKHGKGSKSIRALVEETPDGKLWVFSNNGLYQIDENSAIHLVEHESSILGTLVQWNIKIRD
ncbi:hypothetical protein [Pseudoalteromonas rubra]|nr:hypothetical protein [Pseudoalteromonas rubra]